MTDDEIKHRLDLLQSGLQSQLDEHTRKIVKLEQAQAESSHPVANKTAQHDS